MSMKTKWQHLILSIILGVDTKKKKSYCIRPGVCFIIYDTSHSESMQYKHNFISRSHTQHLAIVVHPAQNVAQKRLMFSNDKIKKIQNTDIEIVYMLQINPPFALLEPQINLHIY